MSQVKIALQPPPNVDFVVGYPGIPPAAKDRPQAAVKGAVEVRVGPQGVKAKWVRVELKKIETLPGGGQTNSYFDFVGSSPINLWQSSEEYGLLQSQDLPFHIRIPESIPPSIALERGAGIRYELVATVCTLGKKGFFRRRKTVVTSQATTIIIDKHELHSTWPVYAQPESRTVNQEGVHLTVERQRTCFGPGDRVSVMAILKSDSVHPVVLRGFEFSLKETTIFRASTQTGQTSKRSGPQVKTGLVGEQKVPLNVTLFGGMQHKAEVGCLIPNTHTTTTLNAARHIDITYAIVVKAWFGSMQAVIIELPVIVSNWPRSVSEEAIRRIGVAPSLCMTPSSVASTVPARPLTSNSQTSDYNSAQGHGRTPLIPPTSSIKYNTAPNAQNDNDQHDDLEVDEVGALQSHQSRVPGTIDHPGYNSSAQIPMGSIQENSTLVVRPVGGSSRRRRGSATAAGTQNRLTITNISDRDAEVREAVEQAQIAARQQQPTTPPMRGQRSWLSAEDEKRKLYESARAKVEQVQGSAVMAPQSSETSSQPKSSSFRAAWPTAEEEKIRLFDKAQATAKRTQALGASSHSRESSEGNGSPGLSKPSRSISALSAGAALYQHAVSSMNKNPTSNTSPNASANVSPARSPNPPSPPLSTSSKIVPHYPSAEEEKAALKRYHEAKLAVDRSQNTQYATREGISSSSAAPVAYDTLYPSSSISRSASYGAQPSGSDMPPPFDGPNGQPQYLNEKERLRRHHEAQDAAAMTAQSSAAADISPSYIASPLYSPPVQSSATSALSEKELLRRRFEERDAAALAQQQPQSSPPRAVNGSHLPPPPVTPIASGFKPLTAAEEKAQLRAKYAAEEQQVNGNVSTSPSGFISHHPLNAVPSPPPPPPLMPRPPAEYIQETQEEDARVRYYDSISTGIDNSPMRVGSPLAKPGIQLDIRPFTPFSVGLYDPSSPAAQRLPPPPPLPPQN